ncbi:3-hydroxybutyryl-CoA dehydrogenase [Kitasatospora sp. SolWspMP-SS2h]|uniref:3-hydroxybutyryl-CoA dehydrogenase n=1 Tax=Kitasatospora sp. SolWspMP-SS2h TaxID=1305729 RepID=UPI000DB94684|nr:3-hydroxybutyryl-CoA dehydrogenase [Kitasatospora sp. SolWspMP-SS2h]RAJ45357.1 3-hydroxybutyryl-CoA dehydrogenase [Kitasatospora sp. SolWspMP-SS2h]
MNDIRRVAVVGAGQMGSGIAEVFARAGLDTVVCENGPRALRAARRRIDRSLHRAVERGRIGEEQRTDAWAHLLFADGLDALADRQLVVEAVVEDERAKTGVLRALDEVLAAEDAVLATNTSALPVTRLGIATGRAPYVLGLHFFNPAPVMPLVELVPSLHTAPAVLDRVETFARDVLGKHVVRSRDRAGFVVNALLVPYLLAAIRMAEAGHAGAADIDTAMVHGCAHPMGPLALADLIGLDTVEAIARALYEEYKEPLYAPPPLLSRMVEAGLLGRKSGRGFHPHPEV